jgi:hypothetical protein
MHRTAFQVHAVCILRKCCFTLPGKRLWCTRMYQWKNNSLLINPLSPELNRICYLLALLAHDFLHVSRIRVKSLTLRLLMSYIYIYIYDVCNLRVNIYSCIWLVIFTVILQCTDSWTSSLWLKVFLLLHGVTCRRTLSHLPVNKHY